MKEFVSCVLRGDCSLTVNNLIIMKKILIALLIITLFTSCESKKIKKEAENQTKQFFGYLKQSDEERLKQLYNGFENFETFYKSDSASIKSSSFEDGIAIVEVKNSFTNGMGKYTNKEILFFFRKDSIGKLKLIDSKGLTDFSEKNEYKFGVKTGCITKADTTDQQILTSLKKSHELLLDKGVDVLVELMRDVRVTKWSWETLYSGSASGHGIVVNNSRFDIPSLKYTVTFKSSSGSVITTEKGLVSYDEILAGGSTSFSFYSSYTGGATIASIELNFDDDLILNYLAEKKWTGKEYEEFLKLHPVAKKNL